MNQPPYGPPPHGQPPQGGYPGQSYGGPGGPGGAPPPGGWGPPPPGNNKGAIIAVVVLLVVAIGVVLTLWLTGVFGGKSSSGNTAWNASTANTAYTGTTTDPGNMSYGNTSGQPYTTTTNTMTTPAGIDSAYLSGRWCDSTGGWMSFDPATNQINLPNGNTGQRVIGTYTLAGTSLSIVGPTGARISGTLSRIDGQTMTMTILGRAERVTRC